MLSVPFSALLGRFAESYCVLGYFIFIYADSLP